MKYGVRRFGNATCLVSACLGVPEEMRKDIREISKVECPLESRGRGMATELLKSICKEADAKRMVLMLTVDPYGIAPPMTKAQLLEWYITTFDFITIQQTPLILARMFNPFPESGLTEKISQIITEGIK